jgi:hypothetical protein
MAGAEPRSPGHSARHSRLSFFKAPGVRLLRGTRPREIVDARFWAGLHYRFSSEAAVILGREVAEYDLRHAFREVKGRREIE